MNKYGFLGRLALFGAVVGASVVGARAEGEYTALQTAITGGITTAGTMQIAVLTAAGALTVGFIIWRILRRSAKSV